jgi:SAM-dependent methyltransferase
MPTPDWNERYAQNDVPWDTDEPDPHLVSLVRTCGLQPGRVLDVGCGTGTHACWLAEQGFDVLGVDISPRAIDLAGKRATSSSSRCRFAVLDFLEGKAPLGPFDFVFDRGFFHIFDDPEQRSRFAARVAGCLAAHGQWLSLIGSTEGPPREHGPPRRSARDIVDAIEPALEIFELRAVEFHADLPSPARAWYCFSRRRETPAQPSTRRET